MKKVSKALVVLVVLALAMPNPCWARKGNTGGRSATKTVIKGAILGAATVLVGAVIGALVYKDEAKRLSFLERDPELKAKLLQWEKEAPDDVKKEIKILRRGNAVAKGGAVVRLGNMGPRAKGAILALIETFRDRTALEWWQYPGGILIETTSPAWEAAKALGKIGKEAVEPLIKALGDKALGVRSLAAEALGEIDPKWRESEAAKRAVPFFIQALGDKDSGVRWAAAWALGEIKDARAVEPLIKALGDKVTSVREAAAKALGEIKDQEAVEPLIKALGDKDSDVRGAAAGALGAIEDPRAVEPLIRALGDKDADVRKAAAEALKKITGKDFGEDRAKWQEFWEQNKAQFLKGR